MNADWINEKIPRLPKHNWLYKIICFMLGKRKAKLSYMEYMIIIYEMNKENMEDKAAKKISVNKAKSLYKRLNGKLPDTGEENDEE